MGFRIPAHDRFARENGPASHRYGSKPVPKDRAARYVACFEPILSPPAFSLPSMGHHKPQPILADLALQLDQASEPGRNDGTNTGKRQQGRTAVHKVEIRPERAGVG